MAIFSGRRDPVWSIPATGKIKQLLDSARKQGFAYYTKYIPARLGFKGFVVKEGKHAQLFVGQKTTELQLLLLQTIPKRLLKSGTYKMVEKAIRSGKVKAEGDSRKYKRYAPPYNPEQWNANDFVMICNNCYNYATDQFLNNTAVPGNLDLDEPMTGQTVKDAAVRDGLEVLHNHPTPADPVPAPPADNRHLVALVVEPG